MDKDLRSGRCFGDKEERKLELRLGPPGEDWSEVKGQREKEHIFDSVLSLNRFSNASKVIPAHPSAGTKRGFFDSIEHKTEAFKQQEQPCFLHLQTKAELEKEILQRTNGRLEQHQSLEGKACCLPPPQSANASGSVVVAHNRSQIRSSSTPVVGWPPIRSSRKNLASSSKQTVESHPRSPERAGKPESSSKGFFVKINMEGIPIGRKIDLFAYDCYEKLCLAVDELFRDLLAAQMDPLTSIKKNAEKQQAITNLLDGSGEYTLIYEDYEGDRMLVGDVPWDMFISTAKRLRVLKSSELPSSSSSSMGTISRKKNTT